MNKSLNKIKDGILVGVGIILVLGIANAWTNLGTVNTGDGLTATIWNDVIAKINDIGARTDSINTNTSGNIGIGTNSPGAKLHVAGSLKVADGTQGDGKVLISDVNGLASWSDPSYQTVTYNMAGGTVVNSGNSTFTSSDVTLSKGIRNLSLGYYLYPSAMSSVFDVHVDALPTTGSFVTIGMLPNFNSENSYAVNRHSYVTTTQLINVTSSSAQVHARLYHSWGGGAYYTVTNSTLTMIATKVR